MQSRIYQQAAYKALDEGDTERARQIATDHLQSNVRDAVMKRIDFREMTKKAEATRIEDVRQAVARLQSDNEKLDLLLQVLGGFSCEEIARELKITPAAVMTQVFRARQKLKAMLGDGEIVEARVHELP